MKVRPFGLFLSLVGLILFSCGPSGKEDKQESLGDKPIRIVMEVTGKGEIVMELYPAKAPETCQQIVSLVKQGFYNGQKIHRVEDWVVQWGDPQSKNLPAGDPRLGAGGSGNPLPFEETDLPMVRGVVAMASVGERVGGDSQIFILKTDAGFLQGNYCAFGNVVQGMDVVDKLEPFDEIKEMKVVE
jgi:cyclophilin family peptidyl-prolyl cis-trans isomerase